MIILKKSFVIVLLISIIGLCCYVNNKADAANLTLAKFARAVVENYLQKKNYNDKDIKLIINNNGRIEGVFVSIIGKNNKSRGCWGSLYPQTGLKEAIASAAIGAVKQDYRFKPVSFYEMSEVKIQVSLVTRIIPVDSIKVINPLRDGLLVKSGSKAGILMPGEAVDAYYQMVQCKLKANIQPGEPYNLFKLVTNVYKE